MEGVRSSARHRQLFFSILLTLNQS
jgi:hypothetical protein